MIVKNNNRPSQEDYQNLINEYKAFMVKYQGLWQMYNQMLQVGNHPAVMQLVASMARLTPMKSYYEMFINQYQIDQYIIQ